MVEAIRAQIDRTPQPVALALGRVVRARTLPEQLEAAIKAAEVVTRYVAMLALSSYSARDGAALQDRAPLGGCNGPLSFGHYLNLILEIVADGADHPLATQLQPLFRTTKKGTDPKAAASLKTLLRLRNDEGHDLRHLDEVKATMIARDVDPTGCLHDGVTALVGMLQMPLLIVEDQRIRGGTITATCLVLRGEGTPFPEELELRDAAESIRTPYLATRGGLLDLSPGMLWDIVERQQAFGVFFLDKVTPNAVAYKAVADGSRIEFADEGAIIVSERLRGGPHPIEEIRHITDVGLAAWLRNPPVAQADKRTDGFDERPRGREPLTEPDAVAETTLAAADESALGEDAGEPDVAPGGSDIDSERTLIDPRLTREALVRWLALEDRSAQDVAAHLGLPVLHVRKAAREHGLGSLLSNTATGLVASPEQVERYEAGTTVGELAAEISRSPVTMIKSLMAGGAQLRHEDSARIGGRQPRVTRAFLKREFNDKKRTMDDIGEELGVTREMVRKYLNKYGLPTQVDRVEDPGAKLSEPVLRQLYVVQGLSLNAIAQRVALRPDQVADLAARYELARPRVYERHGLTAGLLTELYLDQRKSIDTIALELGVSRQTAFTALVKHGIPLRGRHEAVGRGLAEILTRDYLAKRRAEGASIGQIAIDNDTTETTVRKYLADAGLIEPAGPNPRFDDLLTPEFLQREYIDAGLSQGEFCAKFEVSPSEVRMRMNRSGIEVPQRRNSQLDQLPTADSVRTASAAGRPASFPLDETDLTRLYVTDGMSSAQVAEVADSSVTEVLAALCAAGIEVRLGMADRLSRPFLQRNYVDRGMSAVEIARKVSATPATVKKHLEKHGFSVRGLGSSSRRNPARDRLTLEYLRSECVDKGRSATSVANELGIAPATVLEALREHDIPVRIARGGPLAKRRLNDLLTPAFLREELVIKRRDVGEFATEHGTTAATVRRYAAQRYESRGVVGFAPAFPGVAQSGCSS